MHSMICEVVDIRRTAPVRWQSYSGFCAVHWEARGEVGAVLLILADVVGRIIARPAELDVGIVTAFIGAPVFIWIVRRKRVAAL